MPPSPRQSADLLQGLTPLVQDVLARAAAVSQAKGATLWLVGGVVRDLLLGLPLERDCDLTVEGDAVALAHELARTLGGRVIAEHQEFGTATVELSDWRLEASQESNAQPQLPVFLDLARARTETYPYPAALPVVQPTDIAADLKRRDFSVNAIALELRAVAGKLTPARLLDPFAGQGDLAAGVLRALHDASFADDPTRLLRGLRLAARLNLRPDPHTRALLDAALRREYLESTSPDRVRNELCLALAEPHPAAVLRLADEWGLTPHIFPGVGWSEALAERCRRLELSDREVIPNPQSPISNLQSLCYTGLLTYDLTHEQRAALVVRYRLPGEPARVLHELEAAQVAVRALSPRLRASELDRALQPFDVITLLVVYYAEPPAVAALIRRYLTDLRPVTLLLNGHALQRLGVAPGPRLGQLLRELRAARLDGLVTTREDEEAWVQRQLSTN